MTVYSWVPATFADSQQIKDLGKNSFLAEVDEIFTPSDFVIDKNISYAILNQIYNPLSELISVCKDSNGTILAYTWVVSGQSVAWSSDRMTGIKMAHVDLSLPSKLRIRIIIDMMNIWEQFAKLANDVIICSTTMRHDQTAFLKLHERKGYSVRGSFAYKRLL